MELILSSVRFHKSFHERGIPLNCKTGRTATQETCELSSSPTDCPVRLRLDRNEGTLPDVIRDELMMKACRDLNRYPDTVELTRLIARREGVDAGQILVTAGGDDALGRFCSAFLRTGDELILPSPTFEMIEFYGVLSGGNPVYVPWKSDGFPVQDIIRRVHTKTAAIAVVSPNNPTGQIIEPHELRQLADAAADATILVDLAYNEFADADLTPVALACPNALIVKTFSKAWGLAGLRVGFAIGQPELIQQMKAAGNPYPVSSMSIALISSLLQMPDDWLAESVGRVRNRRVRLAGWLNERGIRTIESQANFVLADFANAHRVWLSLAKLGIAVRRFEKPESVQSSLRITVPGNETDFQMLTDTLTSVLDEQFIGQGACRWNP